MICEKHGVMNVTCDVSVCGACYGEALDAEPYRSRKPLPPIDMTYGLGGHDPHYRPKVLAEDTSYA